MQYQIALNKPKNTQLVNKEEKSAKVERALKALKIVPSASPTSSSSKQVKIFPATVSNTTNNEEPYVPEGKSSSIQNPYGDLFDDLSDHSRPPTPKSPLKTGGEPMDEDLILNDTN